MNTNILLDELILGNSYKYDDLLQIAYNDEQLSFEEFGQEVIGFLILQLYDENMCWTFILDGTLGNNYLMKFVNKA